MHPTLAAFQGIMNLRKGMSKNQLDGLHWRQIENIKGALIHRRARSAEHVHLSAPTTPPESTFHAPGSSKEELDAPGDPGACIHAVGAL